MSIAPVRLRVVARGRVQGVFFRDTIQRRAHSAGLAGWVRNLSDGAVEAVFEGQERAVDELVALCRKGPSRAVVESVETFAEPVEGIQGFTVR